MDNMNETAEPSGASGGSLENARRDREDAAAKIMAEGLIEIAKIIATQEWIPVSDRLPDREVSVLVWIPTSSEKTFIASLDEGGMWFSSDPTADAYSLGEDGAPTHWMPLPAPPTDAK